MQKLFSFFLFATLLLFSLLPAQSLAQEDTPVPEPTNTPVPVIYLDPPTNEAFVDPCNPTDGSETPSYCLGDDLGGVVAIGVQIFFVIAVIISLAFLVYGGIKWITSGGDKGGVEAARGMIVASIIGLTLVFLAYLILNVVLVFLTGSGISNVTFNPLIPR